MCQDRECRGLSPLYRGESASQPKMSRGPLVPPQNTIYAISAGEGPGVEGQSAVFNPSNLELTNCAS
jgi:hypothetical protein